jgi:hypothetical protein
MNIANIDIEQKNIAIEEIKITGALKRHPSAAPEMNSKAAIIIAAPGNIKKQDLYVRLQFEF